MLKERLNLEKITALCLYLLVFLLPIQTRLIIRSGELNGAYFEYGTLSLYATDLLLLAVFTMFILSRLKNKSGFYFTKSILIFACLELALFFSIFIARNSSLSVYKYFWLLGGFAFFYVLANAKLCRFKLFLAFLSGVFIQAALAIWQFLNQGGFSSKWLGMAMHDPGVLGVSVIEFIGADGFGERWLRAYGGLDHPNMLGGLMAIGLLSLFYLRLNIKPKNETEERYLIFNYELKVEKLRYFLLIFYLFGISFSAALFFSFSRSAWLSYGAGLLAVLFVLAVKKNKNAFLPFAKLAFASILILIILFSVFKDLAMVRFNGEARLEAKSNIERIAGNRQSLEIIRNNWFLGVGIGNYTLELHALSPNNFAFEYQPVHNVFLLSAAEIGLFGLSIFGFLLFYFMLLSIKKDPLLAVFLISLSILLCFDHWLWSLHFGYLLLFFVFGLFGKMEEKIRY